MNPGFFSFAPELNELWQCCPAGFGSAKKKHTSMSMHDYLFENRSHISYTHDFFFCFLFSHLPSHRWSTATNTTTLNVKDDRYEWKRKKRIFTRTRSYLPLSLSRKKKKEGEREKTWRCIRKSVLEKNEVRLIDSNGAGLFFIFFFSTSHSRDHHHDHYYDWQGRFLSRWYYDIVSYGFQNRSYTILLNFFESLVNRINRTGNQMWEYVTIFRIVCSGSISRINSGAADKPKRKVNIKLLCAFIIFLWV